jgi:glycogen operon protein
VRRFTSLLLARRLLRDQTHERQRTSLTEFLRQATTTWHGVKLLQPDWGPHSRSLVFGADMKRQGLGLHLIMNAYWEALDFELPPVPGVEPWRRWIDTSLASPADIVPWETAAPVADGRAYHAGPRSVVVLFRRLEAGSAGAGT